MKDNESKILEQQIADMTREFKVLTNEIKIKQQEYLEMSKRSFTQNQGGSGGSSKVIEKSEEEKKMDLKLQNETNQADLMDGIIK